MQAIGLFLTGYRQLNQSDSLPFPTSFEIIDQKNEHVFGGIVISRHVEFRTALFIEMII